MIMNKNYYCVIMAGGVGSRFWPFSRESHPKQFLDILNTGRTLLQQTFDRFSKIIPTDNILVVTNARYESIVREQLPELLPSNILLEPFRRNTAPCIAYAVSKIALQNSAASMVVAPSDHRIVDEDTFLNIAKEILEATTKIDGLFTVGIRPNRPETGYGYIQIDTEKNSKTDEVKSFLAANPNLKKVKTFTEKPDYEMAKVFVESGEFFWNSGLFFWSLESISRAFQKYLPDIFNLFTEGKSLLNTINEANYINEIYPRCKNISIDYGIMEMADNVFVRCGDFGWSDLGTWGSIFEHLQKDENGNHLSHRKILTYNSSRNIIRSDNDKCVVVEGLDDYIVVDTSNVLLICSLKNEQMIRQYVNDVKLNFGEEYI
ncbi:MAG: mannose-1-phosphate guanylyltransferase [Bacteroidales bacterium]|nr:mannose-1-phosphate guanylyltransferase [Bacteroidales bacterium]